MLTASARALWPFFVRFSAPSPAWIAGVAAGALAVPGDQSVPCHSVNIYTLQLGAAADFLPALGYRLEGKV